MLLLGGSWGDRYACSNVVPARGSSGFVTTFSQLSGRPEGAVRPLELDSSVSHVLHILLICESFCPAVSPDATQTKPQDLR